MFPPKYPTHYSWCVLNIKFGGGGFMMVDVYYSGNAGDSNRTVNLPPGGAANIYILDEFDNKLEWTKRGGCAQTPATTQSGKGCSGWLIYPIPAPDATTLSFFDNWHNVAITDISLAGDLAPPTATATPD
jgi:hypothetical protein